MGSMQYFRDGWRYRNCCYDHACRFALLPLLHKLRGFASRNKFPDVRDAWFHNIQLLCNTRRRWYRNIKDACPEGEDFHLYWANRCPPVGFWFNGRSVQFCKKDRVCPFCWCRNRVEQPYRVFEKMLWGGCTNVSTFTDNGIRLFSAMLTQYTSDAAPDPVQLLSEVTRQATEVVDLFPALGRYKAREIVPFYHRGKDTIRWRVACRYVFACYSPSIPKELFDIAPEPVLVRMHEFDNRRQLAKFVSILGQYPPRILFSPAKYIVEMLRMLKGMRVTEFSGEFRKWLRVCDAEREIRGKVPKVELHEQLEEIARNNGLLYIPPNYTGASVISPDPELSIV